jgi:hypothetical protein
MNLAETVVDQHAPMEDFAAMLEESFQQTDKIEGTVVTGTVIAIEIMTASRCRSTWAMP